MTYTFQTNIKKMLSDTHTPVELYLKLRDKFPGSFLLESSDYASKKNSFSYVCVDQVASFICDHSQIKITTPNGQIETLSTPEEDVAKRLNSFIQSINCEESNFDFVTNGLFGYTSYDAIPLFEDIQFDNIGHSIPLIQYHLFRFIIVFNHFNNELFLIEHLQEGQKRQLADLADMISLRAVSEFPFNMRGNESTNFTDAQFLELVKKGIDHCYRGDVFQIVLSRKYHQNFQGDEFNAYRALRSVNPSPYMFYFDYGNFKVFGSSPETQLTITNSVARINPIAGTINRSGDALEDKELARILSADPKENAEHVMLVDLARNDLSRCSQAVEVESFKRIEYYSHVIHLVSKVRAQLPKNYNPIDILGNTYPAGTLSGAPKHMAMKLIDKYENENRGIYGGAVGFIGLNGEFNHAIFIRSFLSQNNTLTYQAGCGIVAKSNPQNEVDEINNKLTALRTALSLAETL